MDYLEYQIRTTHSSEMTIALLSQWPFESFLEQGDVVKAYLPAKGKNDIDELVFKEFADKWGFTWRIKTIKYENWNKTWEASYDPVSVNNFCHIRADFHPSRKSEFDFEIIINPKMAFGTAHHETTFMMLESMQGMDLEGKRVLDFGCGTGVLSIMAEKLNAQSVLAIDYDPKSTENTIDNSQLNHCNNIEVINGELNVVESKLKFDLVLANINYNVLINSATKLYSILKPESNLILSGILIEQADKIVERYISSGFTPINKMTKGDWTCLHFCKD